ncbi:MAG: DUF2905 domain-containing protein [Peptococcaceae bacterium]|nr:DUF2905 domain-containing protein [Peptococcaceae bacterium]
MEIWQSFGKVLMGIGILITIIGGLVYLGGKIPGIGRLPGDIFIQRGNFTFYFPLATGILLSIILTVLANLFLRR